MEPLRSLADYAQGGCGIKEGFVQGLCVYAELLASMFRQRPRFVEDEMKILLYFSEHTTKSDKLIKLHQRFTQAAAPYSYRLFN